MKFTAKQIASFINGEVVGNENAEVYTFAKIEEGIPGALSFLANPKYTDYIYIRPNHRSYWLTVTLSRKAKLQQLS